MTDKTVTLPANTREPDAIAALGLLPATPTSQTIRQAAGVPAGAPAYPELPLAVDSTAVTGGLYYWTGAAWAKIADIP